MTKRLVETLSGVGAIHAGELLLRRTAYEVKVWADDACHPRSGEDPRDDRAHRRAHRHQGDRRGRRARWSRHLDVDARGRPPPRVSAHRLRRRNRRTRLVSLSGTLSRANHRTAFSFVLTLPSRTRWAPPSRTLDRSEVKQPVAMVLVAHLVDGRVRSAPTRASDGAVSRLVVVVRDRHRFNQHGQEGSNMTTIVGS